MAGVGVWQWYPETNRVHWSEQVERLWGFPRGTFPETFAAVSERIHPADRAAWEANIRICIENGAEHDACFRVCRPDGAVLWIQARGDAERDADGRVTHLLGVVMDVTAQKCAEEQLKASERRLKEAERVAGIGNWELDIANDRLIWSDQVFRIFELDPSDVQPTYEGFLAAVHPDDRAAVDAAYQQSLRTREQYSSEHRVLLHDGREKWVHERCATSFDAAGRPLRSLGTVQDITDRKLAELAQSRLRRLYITLSEVNQAVVRSTDAGELFQRVCDVAVEYGGFRLAWIGTAVDGGFDDVAAAAGDVGYLSPQTIGAWPPSSALVSAVCRSGKAQVCASTARDTAGDPWAQRARERGLTAIAALPVRRCDVLAGVFCVYADEPDAFFEEEMCLLKEIAADISFALDQMAQAAELRCSEAKYRLLVENQNDLVVKVDNEGRFEFVSPSYCRVFGKTEAELIGCHFMPMVHERDRLDTARAMEALLQPPYTAYIEQRALTVAGWRWLGWSDTAIHDASGKMTGIVAVGRDITKRKLAEAALAESEIRFRELVDNMSEGVAVCVAVDDGADFIFRDVNRRALEISGGLPRADVVGHPMRQIFVGAEALGLFQAIQQVWRRGEPMQIPASHYVDARIDLWLEIYLYRLPSGDVVLIFQDVTARKQAEDRIHELAFYDPLTGLANRRLLRERVAHAMDAGIRHKRFGAVLMLDMDHFKTLNDTRGHDAGDALLAQVARRLEASVRKSDTVGRPGGDEFVVLLEALSPDRTLAVHEADRIAEKLQASLRESYSLDAVQGFRATCSIGVTLFRGVEHSAEDVLKQADLALYEAKRAGRNTVRFFNAEMQRVVEAHAEMESALHRALDQDELRLYFQPQLRADGSLFGLEALLRWLPEGRDSIPPGRFIPLAEETGLILPIGHWVLRAACSQLAIWQQEMGLERLKLSVNVSAKQFLQPRFVDEVIDVLETSGARADGLCLELTESVVLEDLEEVVARIRRLRSRGVRFSLDDFGTGYSSLSYLKRLPLDELKIDTSFVQDIATDPSDAAIVRTILAMGQSMRIDVIAEGVETSAQLAFLRDNGCDLFQGYLFARPMGLNELTAWIGDLC